MAPTSDTRFARLQTDPRFRKPKQKHLKVEIDDRFRDVLESEEFGGKGKGMAKGKGKGKATVDKRGRPLATNHHQDQLKHFYRLRSASPATASGSGTGEGFVDYARGEGLLESSGSEHDGDEEVEEESEVEEEELVLGEKKRRLPILELDDESDSDEDHLNIDLSEDEGPSAFAPEDERGEEDESEEEAEPVPPTKRIAAVNLDWDNLRASDLYAVFDSFLKSAGEGVKGRLVDVKIYPSEFGKARLEKEELEGPGGGMFLIKPGEGKKGKRKQNGLVLGGRDDDEGDEGFEGDDGQDGESDSALEDGEEYDDEEEDEESDDDEPKPRALPEEIDGLEIVSDMSSEAGEEDVDMDKLRQYQLERLRYYYAVATFSTIAACEHVMVECNGTEFERTANMFDLSYVPEEMDFEEDDVKDTASKAPKAYKGNDFVTDALRHSKVKLTWDQDDPNRIKVTRRNLTREEIEEQDFKDYIASSGDDTDDDFPEVDSKIINGNKKSKKQLMKERTAKLRNLLLAGDDEQDGDIWGKAGKTLDKEVGGGKGKKGKVEDDMEITFRPGLDASKITDKVEEENMTSLEKYQLRMKEKKARKKEKMELKRAGKEDEERDKSKAEKDEFFGGESSDDDNETGTKAKPTAKSKPVSNGKSVVSEKSNQPKPIAKAPTIAPVPPPTALNPELESSSNHFSMRDILASEKAQGSKRKRKRPGQSRKEAEAEAAGRSREIELGPGDWKIDTKDERFKALHEEPEFAIDPSNPAFTKTKAMKALLEERRKARDQNVNGGQERKVVKPVTSGGEKGLSSLVQSVKRKMDQTQHKKKRSRK